MTRRSFLLPLTISAAVLLGLLPLDPMIEGPLLNWELLLIVLAPGVLGAALAGVGVSRLLTMLLTGGLCFALLGWRGLALSPTADWIKGWGVLTAAGVRSLSDSALPVSPSPEVIWLLLLLAAVIWSLTAMFAEALEQPAWVIVTLALPFGIAALAQPSELPFDLFLPVALGYAAVMLAAPRPGTSRFEGARWLLGGVAAALAVALTLAASALLPLGNKQPWNSNKDESPIQLSDPTVDLAENLHRPDPVTVLTYSSSDRAPHYLRTTAMSKLTSQGAQLDSMKLRTGDLSGAYDFPGTRVELNVAMRFPSEYLPIPFSPERFDADGNWAWDPETLSVVATGDEGERQSSKLEYSTVSVVPETNPATIAQARAGQSPDGERSLEVPADVPAGVADLLAEVTAGAETDGAKALALVSFFQSDQFTYSLKAPSSSDTNALASFLLQDRSGYCIHFSISMALLARMLKIPARVAVGFTGGTPEGEGFVVTTDNMHAWPELYFEGLGWVPFEPTKSYGSSGSSQQENPAPPSATPSTETEAPPPSPTLEPSQSESAEPTQSPSGQPVTPRGGSPDGEGGSLWGLILLVLLGLLVVLAIPALVRALRTWSRLRTTQEAPVLAASAWREVRDTFTDLGLDWHSGSPVASALTMADGLPSRASERLGAVAEIVERSLYARDAPDLTQLPSLTRQVRRLLLSETPVPRRLAAVVVPRSLFRRRG
ncbi:MAG: transglutaminaseTgpA domain-containing protein [Propionibacteriaceae bacterium]|nr:transglutaminaseTgpA domain-containing protein [Propionibacteriaceae bacterium]